MKRNVSRSLLRFGFVTGLAAIGLTPLSCSSATGEATIKKALAAAAQAEAKSQKKLTGAELYAVNCNRCHPERYAPERTPEQWKTILLHMRTRASLPADQARAILAYLQEDSGK